MAAAAASQQSHQPLNRRATPPVGASLGVILLHASIGDGWREIGDGIVESLHLDQKTIFVEWDASCVGSERSWHTWCRQIGTCPP